MANTNNKSTSVVAKLKQIRIAPRKVRLVCDLVRNLSVSKAIAILDHTPKRAAPIVSKLLSSAVANAVNRFSASYDSLFIKELLVDEGRTLKRQRPRGRGTTYQILKRASHIKITLGIKEVEGGEA